MFIPTWIYKKTYRGYLGFLDALAKSFQFKSEHLLHNDHHPGDGIQVPDKRSFSEIDQEATDLGDRYRGIGVTVGLLGVLIIFCAVAPIGFESGHTSTLAFTIGKIIMMLVMAVLVGWTVHSKLRNKWIEARLKAEKLRYKKLRELNQTLEKSPTDITTKNQVLDELKNIFEGQIDYNKSKAGQYHAIEEFSNIIGWVGFAIAFIFACLHLVVHESWLIFPTAFVPALVGAIHGVNAFLRLSDLAEDHESMSKRLEETQSELNGFKENPEKVLELSLATYQILTTRDQQWVETAEQLGLKVG
jgi:hypothetical protein